MKTHGPPAFAALSFVVLLTCGGIVHALPATTKPAAAAPAPPQAVEPPQAAEPQTTEPQTVQEPADATEEGDSSERSDRHHRRRHGNSVVGIGRDVSLAAGERADSVVSIDGSASSAGDVDTVVSIVGNTRVSGPVRDSAVSILGNTYVDSTIDGDVVAVLGNVELGPHADVGGDVVAVGGEIRRAPSSIVHGNTQIVAAYAAGFAWMHPWIERCLFYGRPLAFIPGIDWAWSLALAMLALYVVFALIFPEGVTRCARTLETQPGMTVLAALITVLLWPLLLVLLGITVIGLAAVPFLGLGLVCAALFGKAAVLAWLGRRFTGERAGALGHPAVAVLIGGLIVLVLYVIPVLGFIAFQLLGLLALGAVVYTIVLEVRARRAAGDGGLRPSAPAGATPTTGAAPAANATATVGATPEGAAAASAAPGAISASGASAAPAGPESAPHPSMSPAEAAALPRAGFWIRMAALLLDVLLIGFLLSIVHHVFHLHLLVLAVYGAVMWKLKGSTVGGMVFDLQVVRQDGRPIDWETAIVRALGCFLSLAVAGLGFFWIAFDEGKQAWHDKIAGTAVVRVPKGLSLQHA